MRHAALQQRGCNYMPETGMNQTNISYLLT